MVPTSEPPILSQDAIDARTGALGDGFVAPDTEQTPELISALDAAAERERLAAEQNSLPALYERAQKGLGPTVAPPGLHAALVGTEGGFSEKDLLLVAVEAEGSSGSRFEQAMYSDGTGYILIFWQDWPENASPEILAESGSKIEYRDGLDIVVLERTQPGDTTRLVRVFDGQRVLTAHAFNVPFDIDSVKELAMMAFAALP